MYDRAQLTRGKSDEQRRHGKEVCDAIVALGRGAKCDARNMEEEQNSVLKPARNSQQIQKVTVHHRHAKM
jgi:hypothetical protein